MMKQKILPFTILLLLFNGTIEAQDSSRRQKNKASQILENEKVNQKPANGDTARIWKNNITTPVSKDVPPTPTPMRTNSPDKR